MIWEQFALRKCIPQIQNIFIFRLIKKRTERYQPWHCCGLVFWPVWFAKIMTALPNFLSNVPGINFPSIYGAEPFVRSRPLRSYSSIFLTSHRAWRFVIMFAEALHWSLFWAKSVQFIPPNPILVFSSYVHLGLASGVVPFGFPTNIICVHLPIHTTFPAHYILLEFIILRILGEEYELWWSSLCGFLQYPITSSYFGPNILLSCMF
jgi:hypothetical protein